MNKKMGEQFPLVIIDGYGFVFRAYHVQPPLISPAGHPVGALYGFTSMLVKLINNFKPRYAVVVLDHKGKNFRHEIYPAYKANRPAVPADLIQQLQLVETTASALNFKCLSKAGFEADDIIATLAQRAMQNGREVIIISSDKDLMQMVNERVKMYDPVKAKYITHDDIFDKFRVNPNQVREVQALIGDKSDNVPGVLGIGVKTAAELISKYGSLENLLQSIDQLSARHQQLLRNNKENAVLSWQLVGLNTNVEIGDDDIDHFRWFAPPSDLILSFLNEYGFKSLHRRITELLGNHAAQDNREDNSNNVATQGQQLLQLQTQLELPPAPAPQHMPARYIYVSHSGDLNALLAVLERTGCIAIEVKADQDQVIYSISDGINIYILNLTSQTDSMQRVYNICADICANPAIKKITYNLKNFLKTTNHLTINACEDLMLMDYLLSSSNKASKIGDIIEQSIAVQPELKETDLLLYYIPCYNQLQQQLISAKMLHLYKSIDLPLVYVLYTMENTGIRIDVSRLASISLELTSAIQSLEEQIFTITDKKFNIASPKQLGAILFDELKLPTARALTQSKSNKLKAYSTDARVLEQLSMQGHVIANLILEYRHLSKLKNTYADALPTYTTAQDDRIHTTFLQCATVTGRLSSINPNLQNIPIRTTEGNKIRSAFIAKAGYQLIAADYSQIELRILSCVADIKSLKAAFSAGKDIHAQTASEIFGIELDQVKPEIRRKAKTINFGIIYGISAFGLARQLNITIKEAAEYIERYFAQYPGIQNYMSETVLLAREQGFVTNMLGRRCYVPMINHKDHHLRALAERTAINAPMQSLASDIVKIAMIKVQELLIQKGMTTKIILQIHDELLFEAPNNELAEVSYLVKKTMDNINILNIPLFAKLTTGLNWQDMH